MAWPMSASITPGGITGRWTSDCHTLAYGDRVPWRPGQRAQRLALEAPYEDVPDHLWAPLWAWMKEWLESADLTFMLCMHFRLAVPDARSGYDVHDRVVGVLAQQARADSGFLLDCIEWTLEVFGDTYGHEAQGRLAKLALALTMGNSAYRIRDDGKGLELRIEPAVKEQVQTIINEASGSPGGHLVTAWNEAYGRTPDPGKAYSEAIKAVEAAAAPVISPNNLRATLGTLSRDLKAAPNKWTFAIAGSNRNGVEDVQRLMSLLWDGQTSRHGGVNPTVPETPEAARAAVHIAATLVQFFVGKSFAASGS